MFRFVNTNIHGTGTRRVAATHDVGGVHRALVPSSERHRLNVCTCSGTVAAKRACLARAIDEKEAELAQAEAEAAAAEEE